MIGCVLRCVRYHMTVSKDPGPGSIAYSKVTNLNRFFFYYCVDPSLRRTSNCLCPDPLGGDYSLMWKFTSFLQVSQSLFPNDDKIRALFLSFVPGINKNDIVLKQIHSTWAALFINDRRLCYHLTTSLHAVYWLSFWSDRIRDCGQAWIKRVRHCVSSLSQSQRTWIVSNFFLLRNFKCSVSHL